MLTITVGIAVALVLLFGCGFIATASVGWFFNNPKPQDTFPSPDKNN
jgi:hypothetical protein